MPAAPSTYLYPLDDLEVLDHGKRAHHEGDAEEQIDDLAHGGGRAQGA